MYPVVVGYRPRDADDVAGRSRRGPGGRRIGGVLAAQELHRLSPPVGPRRRTHRRLAREVPVEQQAHEHQQTGTVRTFTTRTEADILAMTLIAHGIPAHV